MITSLLSIAQGAATSAEFTVPAGVVDRVFLVDADGDGVPFRSEATVQRKGSGNQFQSEAWLDFWHPSAEIQGPGTFRVVRGAGVAVGVDRDSGTSSALLGVGPDGLTLGGQALTAGQADALRSGAKIETRLQRWRKKLSTDAANAKIVAIGDSTTDETTAPSLWQAMRIWHTRPGQHLAGVAGANIVAQGHNGSTLAAWLADPAKLATLAATNSDLVIASWLINDVRLGLCDLATAKARLVTMVEAITAAMPGADILLRMPNSFLTSNVGSANFVQSSGGTINPAGAAQTYSTLIREAYLSMRGRWSHVEVLDTQASLFGTVCQTTSALMTDQIHPSQVGQFFGTIRPTSGGYAALAKLLAETIGTPAKAVVQARNYRIIKEFAIGSAGNGYIDLYGEPNETQAAQFPLSTSDVLVISGAASPLSLSSATIIRPFSTQAIRILLTGDFTAFNGETAFVCAQHADSTTGDRQIVAVDLPSIASGATVTQTATVTGVRTGDAHDATAVLCAPPAGFISAGLRLLGCYPSATDTVTMVVNNPTGGAVDAASASFAFFVVR